MLSGKFSINSDYLKTTYPHLAARLEKAPEVDVANATCNEDFTGDASFDEDQVNESDEESDEQPPAKKRCNENDSDCTDIDETNEVSDEELERMMSQ